MTQDSLSSHPTPLQCSQPSGTHNCSKALTVTLLLMKSSNTTLNVLMPPEAPLASSCYKSIPVSATVHLSLLGYNTDSHNVKEERYNLAHSFRRCSPWIRAEGCDRTKLLSFWWQESTAGEQCQQGRGQEPYVVLKVTSPCPQRHTQKGTLLTPLAAPKPSS